MERFRFDRAETAVDRFGSTGTAATGVAAGDGAVRLTCLSIVPGGTLGAHPAPVEQLFLVVAGEGRVAGPDGARVAVSAGDAVHWAAGEEHASGSTTGLTALALEGPSVRALGSAG
ncbi:cupin domain-containing protein [Streptomyces sp. NRRL B-24484]|uniref:cupin domain-containing protein n=1 Tax=Streptomyces sp. NRRL B-24484 TaxID=1463833 RepID=UPI0004C1CB92|nr:cupin domain-containing protein [Streptomyces sp. NRRL B-24484]